MGRWVGGLGGATHVESTPQHPRVLAQTVHFWRWDIAARRGERLQHLVFALDLVCCLAEELARRLLAEHILRAGGRGGEEVCWV